MTKKKRIRNTYMRDYQQRMRKERKEKGLCIQCGKNPAREGKTMCEECAKKWAKFVKKTRLKKEERE